MVKTDPKIAASMKRDRQRRVMAGVITRSTDKPIDTPSQRAFSRARLLIPARFRR